MKNRFTRRNLLQAFSLVAAGAATGAGSALLGGSAARAQTLAASGKPSPIRLGLASYTFRTFSRPQLIAYMQQFNVNYLSCKDVMDHLPMDPTLEMQALEDYASAGITLHAAGTIKFASDDETDIRGKFDYVKRAGINLIVASAAPFTLPRIEKLVKEYDIRVALRNRGPEDNSFASPFDVLKAIKDLDPRIGCCIDLGQAAHTNANLVDAIHAAGSRLYNILVSDLASFSGNLSQVAVGRGILPFREIFETLIAINYPEFVDLEFEIDPNNPITGVAESFAFLRGVLDGMGYLTRAAS